jgi:hypothetical protein
MNPQYLSASVLSLLQQDPRRYRNFGTHWYLVKAVLKKFYTRDNLHLLGDYMDPSVIARMPEYPDLSSALVGAVEEYRSNAALNMGSNQVTDQHGEVFTLLDTDAGV